MGTLRVLFAISVILTHSYGFVLVGGRNAVQLFYMISGFLMSYVIVERKSYARKFDFYLSRYLRIYPIYLAVGVCSLTSLLAAFFLGVEKGVSFFAIFSEAPISAKLLLMVSNATLFFQDWVMFLGVDGGRLVFSPKFSQSELVLWPALVVPQAWTLGVELSFYLIAPFVLPRMRAIVVLLVLSIGIRIFLMFLGIGFSDPWTYRFFPTELSLFLLGALSHQLVMPIYTKHLSRARVDFSLVGTLILICLVLVYWLIPLSDEIKTPCLFFAFWGLMPLAFVFQARRKWDRALGDLSYPLYICHMLVLNVVTFVAQRVNLGSRISISAMVIVFSVGISLLLNRYIEKPVGALRHRLGAGS